VARRWINTPDNRDGNRNIRLPQPRPQVTRPDPNREALRPARDSRNARAGNRQNDRPENRAGNRAENRPDTRNVGNGASVRAPGSLSRPPAAAPNRQRPTTGARSPDARPNTARDVRRRSTATMRDQGNRPPQQAGTAPSASNWQSRRAQSGQAQRRRSESQAQRPQQARPHMTRPDQQRHMQGRTAPRPMGQRQARR
jgi:hypothetical protein